MGELRPDPCDGGDPGSTAQSLDTIIEAAMATAIVRGAQAVLTYERARNEWSRLHETMRQLSPQNQFRLVCEFRAKKIESDAD
jgi:hypothetical protein